MTEKARIEQIQRMRMHGLYLSRTCEDIEELARELMGMHSWFYRNVPFSAIIRGADITGWKTRLTKTWLYRGTLHGTVMDDLPDMLALHGTNTYLTNIYGADTVEQFAQEVLRYMEDGVFSRAEFRKIFADIYEPQFIENMFSPWGGIFVHLARAGKVAFRSMASRDFDLITAEPTKTREQVLPGIFRRYIEAYGPATLQDAAWFLGLWNGEEKALEALELDEYSTFDMRGKQYFHIENGDTADVPELTLLSGFDPYIVSYVERGAALAKEYRPKVVLKSGICNPTIALHGKVCGIWNIKKNAPIVTFFEKQPKRVEDAAFDMVHNVAGILMGR